MRALEYRREQSRLCLTANPAYSIPDKNCTTQQNKNTRMLEAPKSKSNPTQRTATNSVCISTTPEFSNGSKTNGNGRNKPLSKTSTIKNKPGERAFLCITVRGSILKPACTRSTFAIKLVLWTKKNITGRFSCRSRICAPQINNHVHSASTVENMVLTKRRCAKS